MFSVRVNFLKLICSAVFVCLLGVSFAPAQAHAQTDCNSNTISDVCELPGFGSISACTAPCATPLGLTVCGMSADCNGNGTLDSCDADISATEADTCPDSLLKGITPLGNGVVYEGTTVGPDIGPEGSSNCGHPGSASVHYSYKPDSNGNLTVELCGDFNVSLSLHDERSNGDECPTSKLMGAKLLVAIILLVPNVKS